jgi:hypothetical protein
MVNRPRPSLFDRRWQTLTTVHMRLARLDGDPGDPHLAALDLTERLVGGDLRHMFRDSISGDRWHGEPAWWADWRLCWSRQHGLQFCHQSDDLAKQASMPRNGAAVFLWPVDTDRIWFSLKTDMRKSEPSPEPTLRRPPGPTPDLEWRILVARELVRRAMAGEKTLTGPRSLKLCRDRGLTDLPKLRTVQDWLHQLLK